MACSPGMPSDNICGVAKGKSPAQSLACLSWYSLKGWISAHCSVVVAVPQAAIEETSSDHHMVSLGASQCSLCFVFGGERGRDKTAFKNINFLNYKSNTCVMQLTQIVQKRNENSHLWFCCLEAMIAKILVYIVPCMCKHPVPPSHSYSS